MFKSIPGRQFIAAAVATVFVGCSGDDLPIDPPGGTTTVTKPNVILIVIDTARADHFSAYGYEHETTPNIDALTLDSVLFKNAHSIAPWTLPAHMSIFTGLLPGEHGASWQAFSQPADMSIEKLLTRRFQPRFPQQMLASLLKENGYRTWGFSSNPWVGERTGFSTGFDIFMEIWRRALNFEQFYEALPSGVKIQPEFDLTPTGKSLVVFKERIISRNPDIPFFAFFNFMDPHYRYAPPNEFRFRFGGDPELFLRLTRSPTELNELSLLAGDKSIDVAKLVPFYDAELNYVDFMIGNLINWLRDRNLYDNTLIIVTSDHGEHLGEAGRFSHQLSISEELLRIPLIIKFPASVNAGKMIDNPLVSNLDIYQTILSAIGAPEDSSGYRSSSIDLANLDAFNRNQLISEYYFSDAYLRQLKKAYQPFDMAPHRVIRRAVFSNGHKIIFENLKQTDVLLLKEQPAAVISAAHIDSIKSKLQEYIGRIGDSQLQIIEESTEDPELTERLKSLGYLDGGTSTAD